MLTHLRKLVAPAAFTIALAAVLPMIPMSSAEAGVRTAHPQVFSGTVVTASSNPAAGVKVNVYAMPDQGGGQGTLIGTATTAKNGTWRLPAPAYPALPKAAQQLAAANMGYLNTDAIASSGSSFALAVESAWVGSPTMHAETSMDTPMPMMMRLTTTAAPSSGNPNCCGGRGGCTPPLLIKVLRRGHSYTTVGEWHAYWDTSGGVSYTRGATSNIGGYASYSAGPFTFQGYDQFSTSSSLTMGFPSNGARNSHEMVISLKYQMGHYVMRAIPSGAICYNWRQIDEEGLYDPGHGWLLWKPGKNVINLDGPKRYDFTKKHHPGRIDTVFAGGQFTLTKGSGVTYGVSASVFGVGIKAETNHSTMVAQAYRAGTSHQRHHFVWGNDGNLSQNPQVEYSY